MQTIAVDFDGTLCENAWPDIGEENRELINKLIEERKNGNTVILYTCRKGNELEEAVEWCKDRGLIFDYINENTQEHIEWAGGDTRKIYADIYIDDKAVAVEDYLGGKKGVKIGIKGTITTDSDAWIYDWLGMPAVSPKGVADEIEKANGEDIVLEINSYGGSCTAATEIRQAIKDYEGKVTANILCAMSAATVIACAADRVLISDTGVFMIHNSQSYAEGDYRDMKKTGDMLKQFNEGIINAYEEKTGLSRREIQTLMDRDTFMSPSKAMSLGFVDGIIENTKTGEIDAAASATPLIPKGKIEELKKIIMNDGNFKTMQDMKIHGSGRAVSEIGMESLKKGAKKMTLSEFLNENPQAKAEIDALVEEKAASRNAEIIAKADELAASAEEVAKTAEEVRAESTKKERERIKSLDEIADMVTPQMLNEAKYGKEPIDGPTLAYKAMVKGDAVAKAYMANAIEDSKKSGVEDVKTGEVHAGEEQDNGDVQADMLASHANNSRR